MLNRMPWNEGGNTQTLDSIKLPFEKGQPQCFLDQNWIYLDLSLGNIPQASKHGSRHHHLGQELWPWNGNRERGGQLELAIEGIRDNLRHKRKSVSLYTFSPLRYIWPFGVRIWEKEEIKTWRNFIPRSIHLGRNWLGSLSLSYFFSSLYDITHTRARAYTLSWQQQAGRARLVSPR